MKEFSNDISLMKNSRGVWDLDISKGCVHGMQHNDKGCYGECYAARYAKVYGYDFSKTVLRKFKDIDHVANIRRQLYNIDMPFFRIGVTGDPSDDWGHCLKIIRLVSGIKPIVIITKHWEQLTNTQINELSLYDVCVNTSISALDRTDLLINRLAQYNRLKKFCKSVLRIISCDFNTNNLRGLFYNETQNLLFDNDNILDNVLRVSLNNELVRMNIINVKSKRFLTKDSYFSKTNNSTYTGVCDKCPDMCGINI